ncbi:MAG: hypothetical protein COW24_02185 [Candidatus Kerfeldbacteria bacterium CG15_BIG_FIL_POST_REV_8_21_14_020_45_12]|uniref:Uncharacterized protein n=1 Tax=Candidatus Kerfeldbacteria bacterium CG15_BIG_FIL_POST_REV_8_21_14_020_45_12 TaxID=2014247 RepID=A0A2M7H4A6_9BACT|nr:MAG: hypothetical protein COW24_02185 [Candidatus Kerfeldbacteria bacterium CG15_BIG_FIL_POST_REV_8_21_14_020_45_12]PJA94051.1 MAG: hypothetical protein CO132_00260 [Candidatus Kerfeldbacteria bacterium CG_4_9_14_3_um_filter_45_8]
MPLDPPSGGFFDSADVLHGCGVDGVRQVQGSQRPEGDVGGLRHAQLPELTIRREPVGVDGGDDATHQLLLGGATLQQRNCPVAQPEGQHGSSPRCSALPSPSKKA